MSKCASVAFWRKRDKNSGSLKTLWQPSFKRLYEQRVVTFARSCAQAGGGVASPPRCCSRYDLLFWQPAALVLTMGASASAEPNRVENQCDRTSTRIKTAPWRVAIQEAIGPRIARGTWYFIWTGTDGPSCAFARRKVARLVRLRTPRALRRASFAGLQCRVRLLERPVAWVVRPRTAWAGCWTTVGVA